MSSRTLSDPCRNASSSAAPRWSAQYASSRPTTLSSRTSPTSLLVISISSYCNASVPLCLCGQRTFSPAHHLHRLLQHRRRELHPDFSRHTEVQQERGLRQRLEGD